MSLQATLPLAEMPDSEVALALAKQAVYTRHIRAMQKQAMPEFLQTAVNKAKELYGKAKTQASPYGAKALDAFQKLHPAARAGLIGAGVGAGIGGLSGLDRRKGNRHFFRNALTGALAGGATFGGGALALGALSPGGTPPGATPGAASGGTGRAGWLPALFGATGAGVEQLDINGRKVPVEVAKLTPEVQKRIEELTRPFSFSDVPGKAVDIAKSYDPAKHPYLSMIGAADLGTNAVSSALKRVERQWVRSLPQVTLNADALYTAAKRGRFANMISEEAKQLAQQGGKASKGAKGVIDELVQSMLGTSGKQIDKKTLTDALIAARSADSVKKMITVPGISQPVPVHVLEQMTLQGGGRGGRVTSGPGVITRAFQRMLGRPADPLAMTGWAFKDSDLSAITTPMRKQLAKSLGEANIDAFVGNDAALREALSKIPKDNELLAKLRLLKPKPAGGGVPVTPAKLQALQQSVVRAARAPGTVTKNPGVLAAAQRWWHSGPTLAACGCYPGVVRFLADRLCTVAFR